LGGGTLAFLDQKQARASHLPCNLPWQLRLGWALLSDLLCTIYVVDASYYGSVHFREYRVVCGRSGVVFFVLHEINVNDQ